MTIMIDNSELQESLAVKYRILSEFLKKSFVTEDFNPSQEYNDAITLSENGQHFFNEIKSIFKGKYTDAEIKLCLLDILIYGDDFLIDIPNSNLEKLIELISKNIIEGEINYPWQYERLLYDKYFEEFNQNKKELGIEETNRLLENTPTGVFQIGNYIVGPLGIINSEQNRYLPVTNEVPLWHCNNLTCNSLHFVKLTSGCQVSKISNIRSFLNEKYDFVDQKKVLINQIRKDVRLDYELSNLPLLLINAFSFTELKILLNDLMESNSYFRSRDIINKEKISGSPNKIINSLKRNECFQMILIFNDIDIISSLEKVIEQNLIIIPSTEIRVSYYGHKIGKSLNLKCEANQYGIRVISKNKELGLLRLKHLILSLYDDMEILNWKLRLFNGNSVEDKLESLLLKSDPKTIVKEYLLDHPKNLKLTFEYLFIKNFSVPRNLDEEEFLINKILWKLGFNVTSIPDYNSKFWGYLKEFEEFSSNRGAFYSEEDKENLRSLGVNLFVSLEEILDKSLSFITWTLLSDHYGETKFEYNLEKARHFLANELSGKKITDNGPITFDKNGRNTLYPLSQGFEILANYCEELKLSKENYIRDSKDIPNYVENTGMFVFPFYHTKLFLDLSEGNYLDLIESLKKATKIFNTVNIANLRNRIKHRRDDFPNQTEILEVCVALKNLMNLLEVKGIIPMIYLFNGKSIDKYNRGIISYVNYKNENISINTSSQYNLAKLPNFTDILIFIPSMKLENSTEYIRVKLKEKSDYTEMYDKYPRRRL